MQPIEAILFDPIGGLADGITAIVYEDVRPALVELKGMGIRLLLVSPLSRAALASFIDHNGLAEFFEPVCDGDGGGITAALQRAIEEASLKPERTIFLTGAEEGLKAARSCGVNAVLMMNDPDEARRLTLQRPAAGIVSLHELPDLVRLVAAQTGRG